MKSRFFFTFKGNRLIYLGGETVGNQQEGEKVQPKTVEPVTEIQVTAKQAEHSLKHMQTEAQILQYNDNDHPDPKIKERIKAIAADYHGQFQKLDDPKALLERCKGYGKDLTKKVDAYQKAMTELTDLFSAFKATTDLVPAEEKQQNPIQTIEKRQDTKTTKIEPTKPKPETQEEIERQKKIDDILNLMGQDTFVAILDGDKIDDKVGIIKLNELTAPQVEKLFTFAKEKDNTEKIFDKISYQGKIENNKISVNQLSTNSIKMLIEPFKDNKRDVFAIFEKLLTTPQSINRTIEACGSADKYLMTKLIKQLPEKINEEDPIKSLDTKALVILINPDKLETFINRMTAEQKAELLMKSEIKKEDKEILFLNIFIKEAKGDLIKLSSTILEKMIEYAFTRTDTNKVEIMLLTGPALTENVIKTLTSKAAKILLDPANATKIDKKDRPKIIEKIQDGLSTKTKIGLIKELKGDETDDSEQGKLRINLIRSVLLDKGISPKEKATILIGIIDAQQNGKTLTMGDVKLKVEKGGLYMKNGEYWMQIDMFYLTRTEPKAAETAPATEAEKEQLTENQTSYTQLEPRLLTKEKFTEALEKKDYAPLLISEEGNLTKLEELARKLKSLEGKFKEDPNKAAFTELTEKISANIVEIKGHISQIKDTIEKTNPEELFNPIEGKIKTYEETAEKYGTDFKKFIETDKNFTGAKELAEGRKSQLEDVNTQLLAVEKVLSKDSKHLTNLGELKAKIQSKLAEIQKDIDKATAYETIASKSKDFTDNYEKPEKWTSLIQGLTAIKGALDKSKNPADKYSKSIELKTKSEELIGKLKGIKEALATVDKILPKDDPQKAKIKDTTGKIDVKIKKIETQFLKPAVEKTATLEKTKPKTLLKPIEAKITKYDKGLRAYQKKFDGFLKEKPQKIAEAKALAEGKQSELKAIEEQLTEIDGALPEKSPHKEAIKAFKTTQLKPRKDIIDSHIKKVEAIKTLQESSQKFETDYKPEDKWTAKTKTLTDLKSALESLKEPQDTKTKYENLGELKKQSQNLKDELTKIKEPLTKIDASLLDEPQKAQLTALIKEIDAKIKEVETNFLKPAEATTGALEAESNRLLTEAEGNLKEREARAKSEISTSVIQQLASNGNYKDLEDLCAKYEADLKGILETITPFETIYKEPNKAKFNEIKGKIEAEQSRIAPFKALATAAKDLPAYKKPEAGQTKVEEFFTTFSLTGIELTINDETNKLLTGLGISLSDKDPKSLTSKSKFIDYDKATTVDKIIFGETFGKDSEIKSINIKVKDAKAKIWEITTTNELGSTETIKMKGLVIVKTKTEISAKDQQATKEAVSVKVKAASDKFRIITEDSPADTGKTAAIKAMLEAIPKGTEATADGIMFKHTADDKLHAQVPGLDFQEVTTVNIHHFALLMKRK